MRKIIALTALTLTHAIISFVLFLISYGYGMSRFDTGALPSLGEKILNVISTVLLWPICDPFSRWGGKLSHDIFPGLFGYIPIVINSFIWALVIYWVLGKTRIIKKST